MKREKRRDAKNTARQSRNRNGRGEPRNTRNTLKQEGNSFPIFSACSAYSAVQFLWKILVACEQFGLLQCTSRPWQELTNCVFAYMDLDFSQPLNRMLVAASSEVPWCVIARNICCPPASVNPLNAPLPSPLPARASRLRSEAAARQARGEGESLGGL